MSIYTTAIPRHDPQDILTRVDMKDNDCWQWQGYITQWGYGTYGHIPKQAHRIVYELFYGPLNKDVYLDHTCHTPNCDKTTTCPHRSCVNPDHLEKVTLQENLVRGNSFTGRNARKTHCKQGHEFIPENIYVPAKRPNRRYCLECRKPGTVNFNKTPIEK